MLDEAHQKPEREEHDYKSRHVNREIDDAMPMEHRFVSEIFSAICILIADRLPMVHSLSPFSRNIVLNPVNVNG